MPRHRFGRTKPRSTMSRTLHRSVSKSHGLPLSGPYLRKPLEHAATVLQPEQYRAEHSRIRSRTRIPKNRSDKQNFLTGQTVVGRPRHNLQEEVAGSIGHRPLTAVVSAVGPPLLRLRSEG